MVDLIEEALRSGAVPVAWLFQHEETGLTQCVDHQHVEWGFEKNNPRLKKIGPLYTSPDHTAALVALIEERDRLKVERDDLRGVLSGLSSYLGAGLGDDATTAEQFDRRIREGIEITYAPIVEAWRKGMAR